MPKQRKGKISRNPSGSGLDRIDDCHASHLAKGRNLKVATAPRCSASDDHVGIDDQSHDANRRTERMPENYDSVTRLGKSLKINSSRSIVPRTRGGGCGTGGEGGG